GVAAKHRHYLRPEPREVIKPIHVSIKAVLLLKVDIERDKIQKRQFEIFGRRIVHIRNQRCWVFTPRRAVETFQVSLDATAAMPTYYSCGYLVADNVA